MGSMIELTNSLTNAKMGIFDLFPKYAASIDDNDDNDDEDDNVPLPNLI